MSNLSTTFMLVEFNQPCYALDHIGTLVHDNDSCRSKTRLDINKCIKVHQNIVTNTARNVDNQLKHTHKQESTHNKEFKTAETMLFIIPTMLCSNA